MTNNQKPVKWDDATSSIYVGQAPVAVQTDISEIKPYATDGSVYKDEDAQFPILDKVVTPFNRFERYSSYTYILQSQYSQINGQLDVPYQNLGSDYKGGVGFYSIDKKGNETLIKEYTAKAGDNPTEINVDLHGVDILKIYTFNH